MQGAITMFDHVEFTVRNIDASRQFYRPVIEAIGFDEVLFDEKIGAVAFGDREAVANRAASPFLRLTEGPAVTPAMHLCLIAGSKAAVAAAHAAALMHGGHDNGAPGYRDDFGTGYYAAFVYDPDGHNLEFLYRESQ